MSAASLNPNTIQFLSPSRTASSAKRGMNFLLSLATAVGVTVTLFMTMEYLIRIEKIELAKVSEFTLRTFTVDTVELVQEDNNWLEERIPAPVPPTAPPIKNIPKDTSLPPLNIPTVKVEPTSNLPTIQITTTTGPSTAIPIRRPIPKYPRQALAKGLSGSCMVSFSLDAKGTPFDVIADCTDPVFQTSAERAVGKAAFSPTKNAQGLPIVTHNMVFPLEYKMN